MFCVYCGNEILDTHKFCTHCGKLRIDLALKQSEENARKEEDTGPQSTKTEADTPNRATGFLGRAANRFFRTEHNEEAEESATEREERIRTEMRNIDELGALCEKQIEEGSFRFVQFIAKSRTELAVEIKDPDDYQYLITVENVSEGRRWPASKGFGWSSPNVSLTCEQAVFLGIVEAFCDSDRYNLSSTFRDNLSFLRENRISRWTPTLIKGNATYLSTEGEISSYFCTVEMDKEIYEEERRRRGLPGAMPSEQSAANIIQQDPIGAEEKVAAFVDACLDEMIEVGFDSVELSVERDPDRVRLEAIDPKGRGIWFEGDPGREGIASDAFLHLLKDFIWAFMRGDWEDPRSIQISFIERAREYAGVSVRGGRAGAVYSASCFTMGHRDGEAVRFEYSMSKEDFEKLQEERLGNPSAMLMQNGCTDVSIKCHDSKRAVEVLGTAPCGVGFSVNFEHHRGVWDKNLKYETSVFRENLERFLKAFLAADWEHGEKSLTRAFSLKDHRVEVSRIGRHQFEAIISPDRSRQYVATIRFDEGAFVAYLDKEKEKRERAARREAERPAAIKEAAAIVDAKINAIGAVALYSKARIEAARGAYETLTEEQKAAVTMLHVLETSEAKLAELEAIAQEEEAARIAAEQTKAERIIRKMEAQREAAVIDAIIEEIGTVKLGSNAAIDLARASYDALSEESRAAVTKLHVLESAEAKLAELEAIAQEEEAARIAVAEQVRLTEARKVEADRAHQRDDSLERFEIPDGATRVGDFAFRDCRRLRELIIPESVKVIGLGAFAGCRSLEKVSFPDHLDEIRERAFFGCSSLAEINLPDNLKRIGAGAFLGCSSLKSVGGSPSSAEVADDAFNGCPLPGKPNTHPTSVKTSPHKRVGENRRGLDEKDHWADSFDFDDGYAHL